MAARDDTAYTVSVLGNVIQSSQDAIFLARHAALKAGLPIKTTALIVNRMCGSGFQAVVSASQVCVLCSM